jgi:uncharacterized protein (TIGR02301 family)
MRVFSLLFAFWLLLAPAAAQSIDYAQRAADLKALSRIFGELHHIRRNCEPNRESEIWRNRMRGLLSLEQPTQALRAEMVAAFNDGFRRAEREYPYCDRDARDHAARLAAEGEEAAARLMAPLYEALTEHESRSR